MPEAKLHRVGLRWKHGLVPKGEKAFLLLTAVQSHVLEATRFEHCIREQRDVIVFRCHGNPRIMKKQGHQRRRAALSQL